MNKQYQELFQLVARNGAINAEQAIEALKQKENNEEEIKLCLEMRDNFQKMEDKILANEEPLTLPDYVQLYAGATASRNIIQKNINTWTAVVKEYDDNLIPKLMEVAKEVDDEKRASLVEEYFG